MTEFLQTDIDGSLDFLLSATTIHSSVEYLETFYMPPLDIDIISSIWDQILKNDKTRIQVSDELWEFARKTSIIPSSIFTSMLHQRFTEHRYLESMLELLQQFYIQVESIAQDYKEFLGDQLTFSLKCFHCGKTITPTETLANLLFMAPMAICHHLKMLPSVSLVNEPTFLFRNMPVLFTSIENYFPSKSSFDNAIYKIAGDEADELFHTKHNCSYQDLRIGEYCFCEAMKVDLAESEDKRQKIIFGKEKSKALFQAQYICFAPFLKI